MAEMSHSEAASGLNSSQRLHLLASAQEADKLLGEVESILSASKSKSSFRKYKNPLSLAQTKVVEDYVARIRTQMVRVLESQGIPLPEPRFESVHSIHVMLTFIRIAFEECSPDRMRGYGDLPELKIRELNGLVDEMEGAIEKLDSYLAQGVGQDLEGRLERLAHAGADVGLVRTLERIINERGFVEFRPKLSLVVERLESKSFEIAFFGRVSSGKSSLLNYIVDTDILPVGVNPITSVPTRLVYGDVRKLTVWFADRNVERADLVRLTEFVSEEHNPGNYKHVSRLVVELPSARLRDGVALVDTPGLGSLATSGAAETLAYLPRCDLGVVLIDAGSTLTEDDLGTIRTLYESGIPATVLLSKCDLLAPEDRVRSLAYASGQIQSQLGLTISLHPVSTQPGHSSFLEAWLREFMLPLYGRHQQLAQESLSRKIGFLREGVLTALKIRLDRSSAASSLPTPVERDRVDAGLRKALGRIAETRELCSDAARALGSQSSEALAEAAATLTDAWLGRTSDRVDSPADILVTGVLARVAAGQAGIVSRALADLARELAQNLQVASEVLGFKESHPVEELTSAIKEMPRLESSELHLDLKPGLMLRLNKRLSEHQTRNALRSQIGHQVSEAFGNLGNLLAAWARRTISELQLRFEMHADAYRAHLNRMSGDGRLSNSERVVILRDLKALSPQPASDDIKVLSPSPKEAAVP